MFCWISELNQLTGNKRDNSSEYRKYTATTDVKKKKSFSFSSSHIGSLITLSFSPITPSPHIFQSISWWKLYLTALTNNLLQTRFLCCPREVLINRRLPQVLSASFSHQKPEDNLFPISIWPQLSCIHISTGFWWSFPVQHGFCTHHTFRCYNPITMYTL